MIAAAARLALRTALATLALGGGRIAVAAACGGDGDGTSGGTASGSSSSSGGGGDSATYVTVPACYDSSDVVGYRRCSSYGSRWAIPEHLPALALELTSWTARIDLADVEAGGTVHHSFGDDYNYRVVGRDLGGSALANGLKLRLVGHHRGLYLGVEGAVAHLGADRRTTQMATSDGITAMTSSADTLVMGGAVLGIDRGYGRVSLGAELMGGARGVVVEAESDRGACQSTDTTVVGHAVVEGRVRADVWLTPWITVGAYAGKDVLDGQASAGLSLGGHLRAFDGGR